MDEKQKIKILIVDDDYFLLDMYSLKFNQMNFEVYTASNGIEAIEKLKGGLDPDICLTDIIMPLMNGFEFLEKMQNEKIAERTLKIVLSNKSDQSDMDKVKTLGAIGFIIKAHSTPLEVVNQVMEFVNNHKASSLKQ